MICIINDFMQQNLIILLFPRYQITSGTKSDQKYIINYERVYISTVEITT